MKQVRGHGPRAVGPGLICFKPPPEPRP
jgi:hypothetical protein